MVSPERDLERRARRAYERGLLTSGARTAAVVVPMAAPPLLACGRPLLTLCLAAALASTVVFAVWRGGVLRRGARAGLVAALPPLLLPILASVTGHLCLAGACLFYPASCVAGGTGAGLAMGILARRAGDVSPRFVAAAAATASLGGAMGCVLAGVSGLAGMAAGILAGATPTLAFARPRPL